MAWSRRAVRSGVMAGWILGAMGVSAQVTNQPATQFSMQRESTPAVSTANSSQNPFLGSVQSGTATQGEIGLTLGEAIDRGLKANLGLLLTDHQIEAAQGARRATLSQLLPDLNANAMYRSQQINLAAFGFSGFPGIAPIVAPFDLYDARATLSQAILDIRAWQSVRAGTQNVRAAQLSYRDARDAVVLLIAAFYLQTNSAESRIDTAKAQIAAAEALYNQAVQYKAAGTVPAIDVLRAQVELQSQRHRLIAYENDFEKQKLQLARVIGLPDGQAFRLVDKIPYSAAAPVTLDDALKQAYELRADYQSLQARVRAAEYRTKAAKAQRYPTVGVSGDYGAIGPSPSNAHGTYTATLSVTVPIFDGGRIRGEVEQAEAALKDQRAQLDDMRGRMTYELRTAMLDLKAAADQVAVSESAVSLAKQQEEQARDRFAAGVTNNLEVVQAQEALAGANENYISSLFAFNVAKVSLARAMGGAEKSIPTVLSGAERK